MSHIYPLHCWLVNGYHHYWCFWASTYVQLTGVNRVHSHCSVCNEYERLKLRAGVVYIWIQSLLLTYLHSLFSWAAHEEFYICLPLDSWNTHILHFIVEFTYKNSWWRYYILQPCHEYMNIAELYVQQLRDNYHKLKLNCPNTRQFFLAANNFK